MDKRESLGKIAYDAYHADAVTHPAMMCVPYEDQGSSIRHHWLAAAQAIVEHVRASQLVEEDISLLVEMVKAVACGSLSYHAVSGMAECPFCESTARTLVLFNHAPDCLVVRARLIEGAIEAKLRGVI